MLLKSEVPVAAAALALMMLGALGETWRPGACAAALPVLGALGVGAAALIACSYARYKLSYWARRSVDSIPNPHLIFGNFKKALLFQTAPGWYMAHLYKTAKENASFVGFYIFHRPCLLICDPKLSKRILITDFEDFSDRSFAGNKEIDSFGMRNLFGLRNPTWRYLRTKITPALTRGKLKQMFPLMVQTTGPLVQYIAAQPTGARARAGAGVGAGKGAGEGAAERVRMIDAQDISHKYCTDLIANVALGTKVDSFTYPNSNFTKACDRFYHSLERMVAVATVSFMPQVVDYFGSLILFNSKFINNIFWNVLKKREQNGVKRGDFIDTIIQLKNGKQNDIYKFEGDNLVSQIGLFFSGFESSSTCTAFTLTELARNKHQERAREEIKAGLNKHGWTFEAFSEMKFVDQCILESLRLHPPVLFLDRRAKKNYKIPGSEMVIERGTPVFIPLYGMQMDPKYFPEPEVFDPTRHDADSPASDAFFPFGTGPRMCVGVRLGYLLVKIVLAKILSKYAIYQGMEKLELDPRSTFAMAKYGLPLEFHELNTNDDDTLNF